MLVFKSKDGRIIKFNPYHGKDGRFTSANGATSFTIRSKSGSTKNSGSKAQSNNIESMQS